ncbi:MAG TPA: efflux RND transporter periplasmic adaptor subunit [Hyphomicrobiaceae bacterium]|nr:efflux RND transporter periplasmic adaptor subunit [Hyphomicrobiaceae bacterium]
MQVRRLGAYAAVALIAAAAAYFFGYPQLHEPVAVPAAKVQGKGAKGPAPAPVTAATVVRTDMPLILTAPGTVEPLANVAVKPRVDGQIVEVAFKEGDLVNEGDVLFRLDDRMVKAQIAQAAANIAKDQASLRDAEATLQRREALIDKKIVTEASLDQARFAVEGLKASIAAGQALLDTQKTQLDYLTIRAPITGRTGSLLAKLGATVRAQDSTALVTINQTRPILVSFALPQKDLPALRRALAAHSSAKITIPGAEPGEVDGTLGFVDNQVDKQTGTIIGKVVAENKDEVLWPGQSVEVAVNVEVRPGVLAVPAIAVLPAQQGMITWVIGTDNTVRTRTVVVDRIVHQTAYLSSGLEPGERVVTDGQVRLAPGAPVIIEQPRASDETETRRGGPQSLGKG